MSVIYGSSDPEFVGVFPVRQDIEVIPGDPVPDVHDQIIITASDVCRKGLHHFGFTVSEDIGIAVVNVRGVLNANSEIIVGK